VNEIVFDVRHDLLYSWIKELPGNAYFNGLLHRRPDNHAEKTLARHVQRSLVVHRVPNLQVFFFWHEDLDDVTLKILSENRAHKQTVQTTLAFHHSIAMSLPSIFYNTIVKRNSVFLTTLFVSAFAFEVAFDTTTDRIWDNWNKGKQWKDIKDKYAN